MLLLALLLAAGPAKPSRPSFKASVLSVISRQVLDRWVEGGVLVRIRDAHRGPLHAGETTLLPIVARNVPKGAELVADFQILASDGRVVLNRPSCCTASRERAPGLYVLEPVPELILMAGDLAGLYTATAVVRDQRGGQVIARERLVSMP
jgi:hypothetical protein